MNVLDQAVAQAACSRCGNIFLADDLVRFNEAYICAACKPYFFQVLKEAGTVDAPFISREVHFFPVSQTKLLILSLCTLGFYNIYWFYKNWDAIRDGTKRNVSPVWRSIFALFFVYQLFKEVKNTAALHQISMPWSPGFLAIAFILLSLSGRLPDPIWIIGFLNVLPLMAVQNTVNQINQKVAPAADTNSKFTWKSIVVIVIGVMWYMLILLGSFE